MKIVQAYGHFRIGGIESYILGLSKMLSRRKHSCYILTHRWMRQVHTLSSSDCYVTEFPQYVPEQVFSIPRTLRLLKALDADVLHIHSSSPFPFTHTLLLMGRHIAKKIVTTPHFNPDDEMTRIRRETFWRRLLKSTYHFNIRLLVLRRADAIIALTCAEANLYKSWGLKNVHRIPLGVDVPVFHSSVGSVFRKRFSLGNRPIVLGVGRLVAYKGFAELVKAAKIVAQKFPQVTFVIVGEGPDREFLKALVEKWGVSQSVLFTGYLTYELLRQAYAAANVFVMPSRGEPFGLVLIEAMAAGKPVVATFGGGVPEVVNERSTILVPQGDVGALAAAIETILNDASLANSMAQAAYETAKRLYDWSVVARKIEQVYRSMSGG